MQVAFSHFYSAASTGDKCTLYSDRNLINRRNVKGDVDSVVNVARRFFLTEVEARVVAAAMTELEMDEFDSSPENDPTAKMWSRKEQKEYLDRLSSNIVDKYIVDKEKREKITAALEQLEERQLQRLKDKTENGRYKCRFPGCKKTFSNDGKWRMMHERAHKLPSKRKHSCGGNISLDLALEFLNRIFKGAVKKLGPNANPKSIRRICNAMNVTKKLTENFDNSIALYKRSGKHSHKSAGADLKTLVNELYCPRMH